MKKRLISALIVAVSCLTLSAQNRDGAESYRPKKGDVQASLILGRGQFFSTDKMQFLIPSINTATGEMLPVGSGVDPEYILKIGEGNTNNNSVVNMAGVQVKWFVHDHWDVNFSAALDLNMTPKKNFEEGIEVDGGSLNVPSSQYIVGNISNSWMVDVGTNYYFLPKNERIALYLGVVLGHRMGYVQQSMPYTGIEIPTDNNGDGVFDDSDPIELYIPAATSGVLYGAKAGLVAGAEFALAPGLVLGLEVNPVTYYLSVLTIQPKLTGTFITPYHNIRAFTCPQLKLGFRF